jgi:pyruvate/2-oxoglutarate dehydrogenase complex dihydrolipoamide acyltransferase (E2) component
MPQVTMPQLGEGVDEGTIGKWLKSVGDHVRVGDPLVEVVTDKVNAEVPSPFEGTLTSILVSEGDTVGNDAPIAEVEESAAAGGAGGPKGQTPEEPEQTPRSEPSKEQEARKETEPEQEQPEQKEPEAAEAEAAEPATSEPETPAPSAQAAEQPSAPRPPVPAPAALPSTPLVVPANVRMTPAVRRLARELGVDVTAISGSGKGGRITRSDVEAASAAPAAAAPAPAAPAAPAPAASAATPSAAPSPGYVAADPADSPVKHGDSLKQLSPMRKAIAAHMERFLDVPAAYITIEVDMTPVVKARAAINADYKAREGMSMSYVAYMTKACVETLRRFPDFNAHWTEEGHWRRKAVNIGIAVAVDDGLVVPVIKNAETLSLHGINAAINDLAMRARNRKLRPEDLEGGTFTVDNTGWTGSILTLPIINVPEVAIITMEKIVKRPVVLEDQGDAIAVRSMMNMCIAIDHRATDGAQAGAFLQDVAARLGAVDERSPVW